MKLTQLQLTNWMPHRALTLSWDKAPIVLLCGPNEIGKSSVIEGLDFALSGECARLETKGARKALITEGEKKGAVALTLGDAAIVRNVGDGKATLAGDFAAAAGRPELWPFLVNHQHFSSLGLDARRKALFGALNVSTSVSAVAQLLVERGHDQRRVDALLPAMERGLDAAVKVAKERVSEARGAWKEVTGEVYGSAKALTWAAPVPELPEDIQAQIDDLQARRDRMAARREVLIAERQKVRSDEAAESEREDKAIQAREALAELGCPQGVEFNIWLLELDHYIRNGAELRGKAQGELDRVTAELMALPAPFSPPQTLACPCCDKPLVMKGGVLVEYVGQLESVDEYAEERVRLRNEIERFSEKVHSQQRAIDAASNRLAQARPLVDRVHAHLAALDEAEGATQPRSVEDITADISALDQAGTADMLKRNELVAKQQAAAAAGDKTQRALQLHHALEAWDALATALEPSGVPNELLTKALKPLNDRLRVSAGATGWSQVQVGADMTIYYGQRLASLASESGRWRADAMLTEAILHLAGVPSLILDRVDVLDLRSRSACLRWLHGLATSGELATALVLGTLKEPPRLPSTYDVQWLGEPVAEAVGA
ncbi:AAA family ATPase [Pseudomonas alloputida]|uniref:AAA family ATPase n=1 Tax=Pseudomonas alloputida TaxID=1940621 RepID=UPI00386FF705